MWQGLYEIFGTGENYMTFDDNTKKYITSIIGHFNILNDHRKDSARTGVVEILSEEKWLFLKIHSRLSHWNPEVYAYNNWTKHLGDYAPSLVTSFNNDEVYGIVMTPIQGRTVNEMEINNDDKLAYIYYNAGHLFKKMQSTTTGNYFGIPKADGSPYNESAETNPVQYMINSIESIVKNAYDKKIIDVSYEPLIKWSLDNCFIFADEVPVPTNWDLSQNNWMVNEIGEFIGFIDFENMRWGLSLDSFAVIKERYTFDKPFLLDSFYSGYGLVHSDVEKIKQTILGVNSSIASIVYGYLYGNKRFYDCGARMLQSLLSNYEG